MTLKILALGGDAALNQRNATRDIGGTLGTDTMADAVIEQFRAL